jgi:hypothetical protein
MCDIEAFVIHPVFVEHSAILTQIRFQSFNLNFNPWINQSEVPDP